ncbi:MAG TPA: hypothetical protein VHE34_17765 [Puia sp.]|uniref:hypothetical protein n=1 Tax=Puia sp. TaxID=2045100 RepID=UPI002C589257|nr:hypothetical protein [Puia sp.]HVU97084.1 hypothetical protein [Puia sp.]
MKQSVAYPHPVHSVETKETHMSWVFLAGEFVYKLKKPVKYRFLDLSILKSRLRNCREEVRLNKRLARDIYLGIVPLTVGENGRLTLKGRGRVVDWLVRMKRLPEDSMLEYGIRHHTVTKDRVKPAAALLAEFYNSLPGIHVDPRRYRARLRGEIYSLYRELIDPAYHLPIPLVSVLIAGLLRFLTEHASLLDNRVLSGKIKETHGDLRPEHICLFPVPAIIDCLEFSRDLRIQDTAEELSFLAMECEMMGDPSIGKVFFEMYASLTSDRIDESLITFYKLRKACLRAFLVVRHIAEPAYRKDGQWVDRANAYLHLARQYCDRL